MSQPRANDDFVSSQRETVRTRTFASGTVGVGDLVLKKINVDLRTSTTNSIPRSRRWMMTRCYREFVRLWRGFSFQETVGTIARYTVGGVVSAVFSAVRVQFLSQL